MLCNEKLCLAMPGRTKRQPPPPYKSDAAPTSYGYNPLKKTQPKNKLTVYLVEVTPADHGERALRPGPKQDLERKPNRTSKEPVGDVAGDSSKTKRLMIHVYIDFLLFLCTEHAPKVVQCVSETPCIIQR
jgi:hypothetical protein